MLEYPKIWVMHISPTFPMFFENMYPILDEIDQMWSEINKFKLISKWHKGDNKWFKLFNGSTCFIKSGEHPERIRGQTVGAVGIDELSMMDADQAVFERAIARCRGRGPGIIFVTSTPQGDTGPIGWLLERFRNREDDVFVSRESTYANPYLPETYIQTMKALYSAEFFRQEVEAEPLKAIGLVYPEFQRHSHIIPFNPIEIQTGMWEILVGVDWGYSHAHAVWVAVRKGRYYPRMVVYDEIGLDNQSDNAMIDAIIKKIVQHGKIPRAICPDPAGVEAIRELRKVISKKGLGIRVVMEPDVAKRRLARSVELVRRGLRSADGQVNLQFADSLLLNGFNDNGKNGCIQSIEHYRRKRGEGKTYKSDPHDDNFYTHSMDSMRYPIMCLSHLGYSVLPLDLAQASPRGLPKEGLEQ